MSYITYLHKYHGKCQVAVITMTSFSVFIQRRKVMYFVVCFVLEIAYNLYHTQFEVLNCNSFGFQWAANPFDVTCFCVPPEDDNGLG